MSIFEFIINSSRRKVVGTLRHFKRQEHLKSVTSEIKDIDRPFPRSKYVHPAKLALRTVYTAHRI